MCNILGKTGYLLLLLYHVGGLMRFAATLRFKQFMQGHAGYIGYHYPAQQPPLHLAPYRMKLNPDGSANGLLRELRMYVGLDIEGPVTDLLLWREDGPSTSPKYSQLWFDGLDWDTMKQSDLGLQ